MLGKRKRTVRGKKPLFYKYLRVCVNVIIVLLRAVNLKDSQLVRLKGGGLKE